MPMKKLLRLILLLTTTMVVMNSCATVEDVAPYAALPPQGTRSSSLLLIVHGSGDTADSWPLDLEEAIESEFGQRPEWDIVRLDWAPIAERRLRATEVGRELGRRIASEITGGAYNYELIHMIAHSVGAHVVHAATSGIREYEKMNRLLPRHRLVIHQTLLDPFVGNSIVDWSFGESRFGTGADFAFSYMTSEDRTPMTNDYLINAHNLDLSRSSLASDLKHAAESHYLPVLFYRQSVAATEETGPGFSLSPYAWANTMTRRELLASYDLFRELYPPGSVSP